MTQTHTGVERDAGPGPSGSTARPTPASARIQSIDALRGLAVLGILLINILVMAIPTSGSGPRLLNDSGLSFSLWLGSELTVVGAMRAIFSMLFGAGVVLFSTRRGERFEAGEVADAYYRRTIWLVAFGLIHAFILLAWWDILFVYRHRRDVLVLVSQAASPVAHPRGCTGALGAAPNHSSRRGSAARTKTAARRPRP